MMHDERVMALSGVHNMRDYGGYALRGGGRLRRGWLWRSGQHHDATDADLARIAALDIGAVFDLRFAAERASHPCRRSPGFVAAIHLIEEAASPGQADAAPHLAVARAATGRDVAATRAMMARNYAQLPFRPVLVGALRRYFASLAMGSGPSLIHCMAGKDRTGIAVAMLHRAVGVHRDDVMADYLLTDTAGDAEARIAAGARIIEQARGPMDPDAMRVLMGVEPEYLDAAFAAIAAQFGSEDAYLAQVLGADAAMRERLRASLADGAGG